MKHFRVPGLQCHGFCQHNCALTLGVLKQRGQFGVLFLYRLSSACSKGHRWAGQDRREALWKRGICDRTERAGWFLGEKTDADRVILEDLRVASPLRTFFKRELTGGSRLVFILA